MRPSINRNIKITIYWLDDKGEVAKEVGMNTKLKEMKNVIRLILIAAILTGCTRPESEVRMLKISESEFINVPVEQILPVSEFVVLELTPESALPEYAFFLNSTSAYFLADQFQKRAVLQFDRQGKFVRIIGKSGKGPGEYSRIKDALITENGLEILTGDTETQIFRYDREGRFIETVKAPVPSVYSFARMPKSGDYCFFSGFSKHLIHILDGKSLQPVDSFLIRNQNLITPDVQAFGTTTPGSVLFYQTYDNRIFSLGKDTIRLKYQFETGQTTPTYDNMTRLDQMTLFGQGVLWLVYKALENQDWLYLLLSKQDFSNMDQSDFYSLLLNKKSGKLYRLPENPEPGPLFLPAFGLTEDNVLFTAVSPAYIFDQEVWKSELGKKGIELNSEGNYLVIQIHLDNLGI